MRSLAAAGALLAAVLLQLSLAGRLAVGGLEPSLPVLLVAGWAWLRGPRGALPAAAAAGLLLDLSSTGPLGAHALALLGAAYVGGLAGIAFDPSRGLSAAVVAAIATGVYGAVVLATAGLLGYARHHPAEALAPLAGGAAYNAVLAALAIPLGRRAASVPAGEG